MCDFSVGTHSRLPRVTSFMFLGNLGAAEAEAASYYENKDSWCRMKQVAAAPCDENRDSMCHMPGRVVVE